MNELFAETEADVAVYLVSEESIGKRLDQFAAEMSGLTRSAAARRIEAGTITVDGRQVAKKYLLCKGEQVEIAESAPVDCTALPQDIPLDVVYEDGDIIVVNKPVGMVVHPAAGNPDGTLVNALLYHCKGTLSGVNGVIRPGIVHRIDKDTSGLLVAAKNDNAHLFLAEQLKEHRINRIYYAVAVGNFKEDSGTVDAPIGRHPVDRKRMAVLRNAELHAREAVTHWNVLARGEANGNSFTLLRCELETGRTHQIRVHMASIGHPLLGDAVYGGNKTSFEAHHRNLLQGQCLHAGELYLMHPTTGEPLALHAPMPQEMQKVICLIFGEDVLCGVERSAP